MVSCNKSHRVLSILNSGSGSEDDGLFKRVAEDFEDEHLQADGPMALDVSLASRLMRSRIER
jgi:hypothetical protein